MDQAAPKFHAMSADVQMLTYTKISTKQQMENGTMKMQRLKSNDVRAMIDFSSQTDARVIGFSGQDCQDLLSEAEDVSGLRGWQEQ